MSKIEVDTIDKQSGSTLTLGGSGTAVTLACGATQTGFGRTGTVDWCTTAKTAPFTAVSGDGFFVNTTGGTITVTLPSSPSAGDIVAFKDYANTWDTNKVTLCRNGSKINGNCNNADLTTESQSVTLIYVDGTKGWQDIHDSTANITGTPTFITATGGTVTECGDFKIHTFTSDSTFVVGAAPTPANNVVDYLVVAGGGTGSGNGGGGGGGGGFRLSNDTCMPAPLTSPLANSTGLPVSASTTYPVTVGGGGPASRPGGPGALGARGENGSNSIFSSITSAGGGGAGGNDSFAPSQNLGLAGGSGGGSGVLNPSHSPNGGPGAGNTPPVSPPQGNAGGTGYSPYSAPYSGGGGGGAGAAGSPGAPGTAPGGIGSFVLATGFAGSNGTTGPVSSTRYFAGGGGAGRCGPGGAGTAGTGGAGGGGEGKNAGPGMNAENGGTNTGGGGGGLGGYAGTVGAGGSGIVIIRYKFQ